MTSILHRVLAASALSLLTLTACSTAPPPARVICVGPEDPDDLEDLFDRDIVRHDDARCRTGDPLFSLVSVADAPPIGMAIGSSHASHYRASHGTVLKSRSKSLVPGSQRPSALRTAAPLPAPRTAAPAPSRANTAPSAAKPVPAPRVVAPAPKPAPKAPAPKPAPKPSK